MGHSQKAKKLFWVTLLGATLVATILILEPPGPVHLFVLCLEGVCFFVFPKIQDQEFRQWEAAHPDIVPSSGWKAVGWGFSGLAAFFAIGIVVAILLSATGIAPQW